MTLNCSLITAKRITESNPASDIHFVAELSSTLEVYADKLGLTLSDGSKTKEGRGVPFICQKPELSADDRTGLENAISHISDAFEQANIQVAAGTKIVAEDVKIVVAPEPIYGKIDPSRVVGGRAVIAQNTTKIIAIVPSTSAELIKPLIVSLNATLPKMLRERPNRQSGLTA